MLATRAYALVFVLTLLTAAAVEFVPRGAPSKLGSAALRKQIEKMTLTEDAIQKRVARGEMEESDSDALAAVRGELEDMRREAKLRDVRDGAFAVLALCSALFAVVGGLQWLLRERPPPKSGNIEVEPDEDVAIDPVEAAHELGRLHMKRQEAIDTLLFQPNLICSYCKTRWKPDVIGRIGKRVLVQRAPAGVASPVRNVLGEGWWTRPAEPPPCVKCGSRELVPE